MKQGNIDWGTPFSVKSITREDVFAAGFPRWQAAGLSDAEMMHIAALMGVSYTDGFFLEDITSAVNFVLGTRPPQAPLRGEPLL